MPRTIREIRVEGNIAYVPLTKGYVAVIDAEDVPKVSAHFWQAKIFYRPDGSVRNVYASCRILQSTGKRQGIRMHRLIFGTPHGMETDHIDGDGLNNRRSNLRVASKEQNQRNGRRRSDNTSGARGVTWDRVRGKWQARITLGNKRISLGYHSTVETAAAAYTKASRELHGEFGRVS